jgi:hypothetical protein
MEHAKKMLLVSPDVLQKIGASDHTHNVPKPSASSIDNELKKLLADDTITVDEKWAKVQQGMLRYLRQVDKDREPLKISLVEDSSKDDKLFKSKPGISYADIPLKRQIVQSLGASKALGNKAANFVEHVFNNNGFRWNDRGIVSINGHEIPGSNIVDITNDLLRQRTTSILQMALRM